MMSALMSDLIEGKITPGVGNATVNAGGKLLKMVELQMKYGQVAIGKFLPDLGNNRRVKCWKVKMKTVEVIGTKWWVCRGWVR